MTTGLEIAQTFFQEWGLPYLRENFPHLEKRVMAGLFHGPQIYGADDDLSQDHGWGPMFTLFLSEEDYTVSGEELARRVRADAPRQWQGFRFHYPDENIEVIPLERFFRDEIGYDDPEAWQKMKDRTYNRDFALYRIRHGHVFYDPAGEFARWRAAFHTYPRFIWLARVEQELFQVWHYGQYNFLDRLTHRRDPVAIQIALGHFTEAVMRLCLLLEHDYGPYWKWLAFEFRKRVAAQQLDPLLRALAETLDMEARGSLVHTICEEVHRLLDESGLSREHPGWDGWHPHPLMCDLQALKGSIQREEQNAWTPINGRSWPSLSPGKAHCESVFYNGGKSQPGEMKRCVYTCCCRKSIRASLPVPVACASTDCTSKQVQLHQSVSKSLLDTAHKPGGGASVSVSEVLAHLSGVSSRSDSRSEFGSGERTGSDVVFAGALVWSRLAGYARVWEFSSARRGWMRSCKR